MQNFLMLIKNKMILGGLGVYLLTAGISYFAFTSLGADKVLSPAGIGLTAARVDPQAPKTEECPLNGQKYSKAEKDIWEARAPLGVMIENHEDSRPQSGLSKADVVYEALAEGGVTRFLAIFYCGVSAEDTTIGPVRSARIYYMDWVSEYGKFPLYTHVGGANRPGPTDALGAVRKYGWERYNDLNQFSIGFPTFWRDYERFDREVATEHTMYSSTDKLWDVAGKRGLTNEDEDGNAWNEDFTSWSFADGKAESAPSVGKISFPFWEGFDVYSVGWTFDTASNMYLRENGGQSFKDLNTNEQVKAANVVVMYVKARGPVDEEKHLMYDTIGTGKALVFQNGNKIEATWKKPSRTGRTIFKDSKGKVVDFVRGPIWIEVLDPSSKVDY